MAIYEDDSKWIPRPGTPLGGMFKKVYIVDTEADIANLPNHTQIEILSKAYVRSTKKAWILTGKGAINGWEPL